MPAYLIEQYSYIALISMSGFVLGFLLEKLILPLIESFAKKTSWKFDDVIFSSLKRLLPVWTFLISFSIAQNLFDVNPTFNALANKLSFSLAVFTLAILAIRFFSQFFKFKTNDDTRNLPSTSIILNIIRVVILLIALMLILQVFDVSVAPILTALGVGGLAVALALQETLSNLFSGIQIIASEKIRNGDYIKLDSGQEGMVIDITWRNTIIKALQNNLIIIPNSKLSSAIIVNYNFPEPELALSLEVSIAYESDLDFVEKLSMETAREVLLRVEGGLSTIEPSIRYHDFGDSAIGLRITVMASEYASMFLLKHELVKAIHKKYKEHDVEMPYPMRTVIIKK